MTVSPAIALDRLAHAGTEVASWRLATVPDDATDLVVTDAAGRDCWHQPRRPEPGESALIWDDPPSGQVLSIMVVGDRVAGALAFEDTAAWAAHNPAEPVTGDGNKQAAELACRAARQLGLGFAVVSVTGSGSPSVLLVEAGPDLAAWDQALSGRLACELADHLAVLAAGKKGGRG